MSGIKISSTSRVSAVVEDVVLRATKTTRLVFRPTLITNMHDQEASVKGAFLFQRKSSSDNWEDFKEFNLSQLRATEWIQLDLKSAEMLDLFRSLSDLYAIYRKEGIPLGAKEFISVELGLSTLLDANEGELMRLLDQEMDSGSELLSRLLRWLTGLGYPNQVVDQLERLQISELQELSSLAGLTTLKACLRTWRTNRGNSNEEFWQEQLSKYSFVLSQVFAHPTVVIEDKAFVGGKNISNKGGKIVDFLAQNYISKNLVLIEIKTPVTQLLGKPYRGIFEVSGDLSGAIVQVLDYKSNLENEYYKLKHQSQTDFESFQPICVVICGTYSSQINSSSKKRTFELFRSSLQGIQLMTYDELFKKVEILIELMESPFEEEYSEEDDIPF